MAQVQGSSPQTITLAEPFPFNLTSAATPQLQIQNDGTNTKITGLTILGGFIGNAGEQTGLKLIYQQRAVLDNVTVRGFDGEDIELSYDWHVVVRGGTLSDSLGTGLGYGLVIGDGTRDVEMSGVHCQNLNDCQAVGGSTFDINRGASIHDNFADGVYWDAFNAHPNMLDISWSNNQAIMVAYPNVLNSLIVDDGAGRVSVIGNSCIGCMDIGVNILPTVTYPIPIVATIIGNNVSMSGQSAVFVTARSSGPNSSALNTSMSSSVASWLPYTQLTGGSSGPPASYATGRLIFKGQPAVNDTVMIGSTTYTFSNTSGSGMVLIGSSPFATFANLAAAITSSDPVVTAVSSGSSVDYLLENDATGTLTATVMGNRASGGTYTIDVQSVGSEGPIGPLTIVGNYNDSANPAQYRALNLVAATSAPISGLTESGNTWSTAGAYETILLQGAGASGVSNVTLGPDTQTEAGSSSNQVHLVNTAGVSLTCGSWSSTSTPIAHSGDTGTVYQGCAPSPTIASGFGTSPSVTGGALAFSVTVGGTGSTSPGVLTMPPAATGWSCSAQDVTTSSASVFVTKQTGSTTSSVTLANFNSSGSAAPWANGDVLQVSCAAH